MLKPKVNTDIKDLSQGMWNLKGGYLEKQGSSFNGGFPI